MGQAGGQELNEGKIVNFLDIFPSLENSVSGSDGQLIFKIKKPNSLSIVFLSVN